METNEARLEGQFEILEIINGNRTALKRLIHILFVVIFLLLIGLIYLAKRPPLVIRIDKLGNSEAIADYQQETTNPSDEDIQNFTKRFLDDYIALKSNLVVRQFETSLNMMTPDLAKQHLQAMKEQNTVGIVQAAGIRNDLRIDEVHSEQIADEYYIKVKAVLDTRPLDDLTTPPKQKPILASLVLKKVPRSGDHPFALLTKGVQIVVDKNGIQAEENLGEVIDESQHQ